ncbi:MAG TPA: ATP-binding protein [Candidatus Dormibacteraeota bacterium]|nr:ATP-binding protein [Candidatus Dormibacteraeota bacterium]
MIWQRWRKNVTPNEEAAAPKPFEDLIEEAPVIALLLDRDQRVLAANEAARRYFDIDASALPRSLVEVTLEGNLVGVLRAGTPETETQLVHRRRTVASKLVPGPRPGETLMFLTDVTDLRRLERVRQEFVANLVHELKTPITSLRLTAESLEHEMPPEDRSRFVRRIVAEADLLSMIIDNLRQLAELDSGEPALRAAVFDLRDLLEELRPRAGSAHALNLEVADGITLKTDRTKLAQALGNLLDNAAKFSPAGSPVDMTALVVDGRVQVSVRDRGPGISPEHWGRVFERFYKVDRARTRESGGFGLGLAIAKHLVQSIGGRIWTEAADEGGQVFTIELPSSALMRA